MSNGNPICSYLVLSVHAVPCAATLTGIKYPHLISFILWENVVYMGFIVFIYHIIKIHVARARRSSGPMRHDHSPSLSLCGMGSRDMPYQIRPWSHIQYIPFHWLVLPTIELPPPLFLRRETDAYVYISFHFYSYSIIKQ